MFDKLERALLLPCVSDHERARSIFAPFHLCVHMRKVVGHDVVTHDVVSPQSAKTCVE